MPVYQQTPVRLQLSNVSDPSAGFINRNTGLPPRIWRGQSVVLQLGFFNPVPESVDLTNVAYLLIVLQSSQDALFALWSKQIDAVDITPKTIGIGPWLAGTAQQASQPLTPADTDQSLDGTNSKNLWLIVKAVTNDGAEIVYGAGPFAIVNPGNRIPAVRTGLTSREKQTTEENDVTVTPTAQIFTSILTVSGAARTFNIILGIIGVQDGAQLSLIVNLPATADIIANVRSGVVTNPVISTLSTGSVLQALLEYYFDADAVAWVPKFYALPPT